MIYNMDFLISAMVILLLILWHFGYFFSLLFLERQMLLLNFSLITILLHTTAIWKMPQSS